MLPGPPSAITEGECRGFLFAWRDRDAPAPPELPALDPAFIRFSSGTTARSKGVVLSHEATAARVEAADRVIQLTPDDRIVWVLPLAYHFAVTIVAYVRAGAHVLLCPDTLPHTVLDAMGRFDATILYASPLHVERLGNLEPRGPLTKLRLALSTAAPITAAVADRFESVHGVPVAQAYGIIEAGLPCINMRTNGLPATSVGHPVPGYEIAVFAENGDRVSHGDSGEIGIRGPGLFSAYYVPWQRREQVMRDGWFLTGDVGRLDATGALHLLGRTKGVIFVAGVKFFAEEVEECLNRFPGVRESRVFGEPHARLGQVPRAEIVLTANGVDLDALRDHCARALSAHKVPVELRVVPALEKTPGGKILRR
jgi:acyl-coenzyme A synthetase/AMP-(fatty) acid ligase